MESLTIVKIGGNVIDNEIALAALLRDFALLPGKKMLVHGGGKIATELASKLGVVQEMIEGRRVTNEETLKIVTMVYGGYINKNIVAALQARGCNAIGVAGMDANLIPAGKRPATAEKDYGFVGDPQADLPLDYWTLFIDNNLIPVVAPLTHDGRGQVLNTNADTITNIIATALSKSYKVRLLYLFDKRGVLLDLADETSVLHAINLARYQQLKQEQKIADGMIPKLDNAFQALQSGVHSVILGKASDFAMLLAKKEGTLLTYD